MLTVEADARGGVDDAPDEGYEAMGWTVRLNGQPIGRAWKSRLMDSYTMQINGLSITAPSVNEALDRARRYLGDVIEPFPPDDQPYECRAHEHAVRRVRYLGPVQFEICADPKCAKIFAMCEHSKNTWNAEGTTLTCDFCGRDVT